jgi:hypothetical protein
MPSTTTSTFFSIGLVGAVSLYAAVEGKTNGRSKREQMTIVSWLLAIFLWWLLQLKYLRLSREQKCFVVV